MAQKRKKAPAKSASTNKKGAKRSEADYKLISEVKGFLIAALGVILGIFTYLPSEAGFLVFIRDIVFGLFGLIVYLLPVLVAAFGIAIIVRGGNPVNTSVTLLIMGIMLSMLSLLDICATRIYSAGDIGYLPYLGQSFENGKMISNGGLIGGIFGYLFEWLLGNAGAIVLFVALIIAGLMVLTRFSIRDVAVKIGGSIKESRAAKQTYLKTYDDFDDEDKEAILLEQSAGEVEALYERSFDYEDTVLQEAEKELYVEDVIKEPEPPQEVTFIDDIGMFPPASEQQVSEKTELKLGGDKPRRKPASANDEIAIESKPIIEDKQEFFAPPKKVASRPIEKKTAEPIEEAPVSEAYQLPTRLDLLDSPKQIDNSGAAQKDQSMALALEQTLRNFNIEAEVTGIVHGPTVTRYEVQPAPGIKVSRIVGLSNDIALNLAASSIRIEAPIPGKAAIGIEVPNAKNAMVTVREMLDTDEFRKSKSILTFAAGKDITGKNVYGDLAAMPHLLIAGTTGAGKSVCVNGIIMSILYKASPDEVEFMMVDPKVVEMRKFNGIPHMRTEVVTDPKKAPGLLYKAVETMLYRYKVFADAGVRDIDSYNEMQRLNNQPVMKKTVIVIDELADLMMASAKEVEDSICRIAQLGRASGIHLIIATQSPRVDVITGLIKANIPSRIALTVSSSIDSRTILDMSGAEKLLGKGDMLYMPVGQNKPIRLQGCFISDKENGRVIDFLKNAGLDSNYDEELTEEIAKGTVSTTKNGKSSDGNFEDEMTLEAARLAIENEQISTSMLQRRLRLGYARAARIVDELEDCGIVSAMENNKREVLMTMPEFEAAFGEGDTGENNDWD